jgi:uncharacterized protein
MPRLRIQWVGPLLMVLATFGVLVAVAVAIESASKIRTIRIAAGARTGDSYLICQALKAVAERTYPKLRVTILETAGTVENLRMMDAGRADVATAQADVGAGSSARSVAVLFDDVFQLLIHEQSSIDGFADLRGKTIGLSRGGGQFYSFLRVAAHFNLRESEFRFAGDDEKSAEESFASGKADALFRVRALGNPTIQHLVERGHVRLLPIPHAAAMRIEHAAFDPAVIPAGAYRGEPALPAEDLPTIAIHRFLLAREDSDALAIRWLTEALLGNRQTIMDQLAGAPPSVRQLLAQTRRPQPGAEFCPALHSGAAAFYDKDKPSFIQAHADFVGLLFTVVIMIGSWVWQFKGWLQHRQKSKADEYTNKAVALISVAEAANTAEELAQVRADLLRLLTAAVADLDADKLSENTFDSFRAVLTIAIGVAKDRRDALAPVAMRRISSG